MTLLVFLFVCFLRYQSISALQWKNRLTLSKLPQWFSKTWLMLQCLTSAAQHKWLILFYKRNYLPIIMLFIFGPQQDPETLFTSMVKETTSKPDHLCRCGQQRLGIFTLKWWAAEYRCSKEKNCRNHEHAMLEIGVILYLILDATGCRLKNWGNVE